MTEWPKGWDSHVKARKSKKLHIKQRTRHWRGGYYNTQKTEKEEAEQRMWNVEEEERSNHCGLLQTTNDMLRQDEFIQAKIVYNVKCGALFFIFISLDFFIQILHQAISIFRPKYGVYPGTTKLIFFLREPCEPWKLATVLRTIRSNRGLSGFMLFFI